MPQHESREVTTTEMHNYLDFARQDIAQLEAVTASAFGLLEHIPFAANDSRAPTQASRLLCLVALIHRMTQKLLTRIDTNLEELENYSLVVSESVTQRKKNVPKNC